MSTILTRFEVLLPTDIASATAVNSFLNTLGAIVPFIQSQADQYTGSTGAPVQFSSIYGQLTSGQTTSALAALTTLNAALADAGDGPVSCNVWQVTTEP
jgi:hypothetical protein